MKHGMLSMCTTPGRLHLVHLVGLAGSSRLHTAHLFIRLAMHCTSLPLEQIQPWQPARSTAADHAATYTAQYWVMYHRRSGSLTSTANLPRVRRTV